MTEPYRHRQRPGVADSIAPPTLWRAFAGYGVWAVCFTVLYTGHALGCTWMLTSDNGSLSVSPATVTVALAGIWLFFVVYVLVLAIRSGLRVREARAVGQGRSLRFMVVLTLITDVSALAAVIITGLPIILTKACV